MSVLKLSTYPNPLLRKRSQAIQSVGSEEISLLDYMAETMYVNRGIGLAAPQVGIPKRVIVVDTGSGLLKMINPQITSSKGTSLLEEGCLSLPGRLVEVQRAVEISVSFVDIDNKRQAGDFSALTAKAIQHEVDHLNGKLIIDYLPWYKRRLQKKGETTCLQ